MMWKAVAFVTLLGVLWSPAGRAQLTSGTISGTVTDSTGAVIPGATITTRNTATGISRSTASATTGRYEVSNLPVGNYEVSVSMSGFQTLVRSGIELTVGRNAVVDVTMQVGEVTQVVNVTGEAPLVETSTATVSSLVDEKKVADLPLNNRDLTQLVFLQPGVLKIPTEQFGYRSGMGETLSVSGARGSQNIFLLDGVSNSDLSGNAQGASSAYIGAETVKEFQIITNNYSAEYQSLPGAIISAVTKSGTNAFHGSVFHFLRNDNLDVFKWESKARVGDQTPVKPEFKRNQFGGSLGGPIVRDRTFFFGSYEGLRERKAENDLVRVPSADAHRGVLPDRTVTIAANIRPYLALYPIPGVDFAEVPGSLDASGTVQITGIRSTPTNDDFVASKIDHHFASEKAGFLTGTYNFDDGDQSPFDMLGALTSRRGNISRKHVVSVGHTSILSPTTLNEFNFGYTSAKVAGEIPQDEGFDWTGLKFNPNTERMGRLRPSGVMTLGYPNSAAEIEQNQLTFKDSLSLTRGNHSLRMGAQIDRFRYNLDACSNRCYGEYRFRDLRRFLTGDVQRFEAIIHEDSAPFHRNLNQLMFGIYLQDNYRFSNALTLNLGMRYEFVTVPEETNGLSAALVDFQDEETTLGPYYTNASLKSFSPRIGFAWAPGSRKTSLRGGVGIFYDQALLYEFRTTTTDIPPFTVTGRLDSNINFPNAYTTQLDRLRSTESDTGIRGAQYDQEQATIYRWSMTLQRELGTDWVLSAGYTGARAYHLWNQYEANVNRWIGWPENPTGTKLWPDPDGPAFQGRVQPHFGDMRWQAPNGNSYHHGLELGVRKRLSQSLQLQVSYTLAKTIDQGADVTSGELAEGQRQIYFWDLQHMRGLSSQDIRHSFVSNFSYGLPRGDFGGFGNAILNGWQLNGILTLASGAPITISDSRDDQEDWLAETAGLRPDLIPGGDSNPTEGVVGTCAGFAGLAGRELGGPDTYFDPCQFALPPLGRFGTLGRSTLIYPGLATFDFSIFKDFNLTEESRIQFRTETFNLFNRPNFGSPDASPWNGNGTPNVTNVGRINRTRTTARQIQFGLKYLF